MESYSGKLHPSYLQDMSTRTMPDVSTLLARPLDSCFNGDKGQSPGTQRNTLSSTEAEYRALSDATRETVWINTLLADLGMKDPLPITIFCDNESCIKLVSNPVFHSKTKHIRTHYHFTREKVAE
jgi:hypothetical protein